MGSDKLHTIRILHKIIDVRKSGRNGDQLEVDMSCALHKQQLVHEDFKHVASLGVTHHVHFVDDDRAVVLERLCFDQVVYDIVRLLNGAHNDVLSTVIPVLESKTNTVLRDSHNNSRF